MTYLWPTNLWLLLIVPVLVGLYAWAQRRRRRYTLRYSSLSMVRAALDRGPGIRRHIPAALFLAAMACMAFALARPVNVVRLPSEEGTVILAIDVSGSMLADDLKPNRMEAAKAAAKAFVEQQGPDVEIGVVSFSSDAQIVQAPTTDKDLVDAAIGRLQPLSGTAIGRGILSGLDAIFNDPETTPPSQEALWQLQGGGPVPSAGPFPAAGILNYPATIVLVSDGQNNVAPAPVEIMSAAINRGVRVYTVGLGTVQGATVHIRGRSLHEVLDEATLKQIAQVTNAQYFNAATEKDLSAVYRDLKTQVVLKTQKLELTALFTGMAALFMIAAGALSLLWFNRLA